MCPGNHEHAEGRGEALRRTESKKWKLVDIVHSCFSDAAAQSESVNSPAIAHPAISTAMSNPREADPTALAETAEMREQNQVIEMADEKGNELFEEAAALPEHYGSSITQWSILVGGLSSSLALAKDNNYSLMQTLRGSVEPVELCRKMLSQMGD